MSAPLSHHPLLRILVPWVGGIVCSSLCSLSVETLLVGLPLLFLLAIVFGVSLWKKILWLYGLFTFLFWAVAGYLWTGYWWLQTDFTYSSTPLPCRWVLTDTPRLAAHTLHCQARLDFMGDTAGIVHPVPHSPLFQLTLAADSLSSILRRGDELWALSRLSTPSSTTFPDGFDYGRYLRLHGITGTAYLSAHSWQRVGHTSHLTFRQRADEQRDQLAHRYAQWGIAPQERAILTALTLGDKSDIDASLRETYAIAGASHVLALSGLHVGILYILLTFCCSPLYTRFPRCKPLCILFMLCILAGFAYFTGLSPSVVRAVTMCALLLLLSYRLGPIPTFDTLLTTVFLMLLWRPLWLFDVGFQLSFAAVAGILWIHPRLMAHLPVCTGLWHKAEELLSISLAAQLATTPFVLYYFARFSPWALLTSLWLIPWVSFIMYAAVFLWLITPFPAIQTVWAHVVEYLLHSQHTLLHLVETLPFASIDHLILTLPDVFMFYLLLWLCIRYLQHRTASRLCYLLSGCLLALVGHTVVRLTHLPQHGIAIYGLYNSPAIHCLTDGSRSWLVYADSVADTSRLVRALTPHWNRQHLLPPTVVSAHSLSDGPWVSNQLIVYGGRRMGLITDNRWQYYTSSYPLPVDYLYLARGYRGGAEELLRLFRPTQIIADTTLPSLTKTRIQQACLRWHIPCHWLAPGTVWKAVW